MIPELDPDTSAARLRLFNTSSRQVDVLHPLDGHTLRMYCCGPTVYGPAHIGNFRTFILQDVLRRVAEGIGLPTLHVRNITDVDDKTIRQSQAENLTLEEFTRRWTQAFHADCEALNLLPPHIEPSAVAHIPEQIELIRRLVEKQHAYRSEDGSVYFRVSSFPPYGRLSRLQNREIATDTSARAHADEYSRDSAADFALWKSRRSEDGKNFWSSPWGDGRPGWHIECSAMAMKHLGESFDLHSGGIDLIFPHHENEIAQSEAASGKPFVRHWFHVSHLLVDQQKMSKSLGNLHTVADVVRQGYDPSELRFVFLSGHYRQPLNFTWHSLQSARMALRRIQRTATALGNGSSLPDPAPHPAFHPVMVALLDDLNTPAALGRLFECLHAIEASLPTIHRDDRPALLRGLSFILERLGLLLPRTHANRDTPPESIRKLAEKRWLARTEKNWPQADRLRFELEQAGWAMADGKESFTLTAIKQATETPSS